MFEMNYEFRNFFGKVMNAMFKGMLITAVASLISTGIMTYASESIAMLFLVISFIACIAELVIVYQFRKDVMKLDYAKASRHFILYSIVSGISLGVVLSFYSPFAICIAFATTCAYFGLLYSITTVVKTDFSMVGRICMSALIPLIIVSIILVFINAPQLYWIVTFGGMAIFTGLTLYDFKKIEIAYQTVDEESEDPVALYLALELYLDFMNLFLYILRLVRKK